MLPDSANKVVDRTADQFSARSPYLPPKLVELFDLLSGELNLRLLHYAGPRLDAVSASRITDENVGCQERANAINSRSESKISHGALTKNTQLLFESDEDRLSPGKATQVTRGFQRCGCPE